MPFVMSQFQHLAVLTDVSPKGGTGLSAASQMYKAIYLQMQQKFHLKIEKVSFNTFMINISTP